MENEGRGRAVLLGVATFLAMIVIGILSVFAVKSLEPQIIPVLWCLAFLRRRRLIKS